MCKLFACLFFQGEYAGGFRNGPGSKRLFHVTISGTWANDVLQSPVTCEYDNGDTYIGTFDEQQQTVSGSGTYHWANGDKYVGPLVDGRASGAGSQHYINGDKYKGDFLLDQRQGFGYMTYNNGDQYTGNWQKDSRDGEGTMEYCNGDVYNGDWKFDRRHGNGTLFFFEVEGTEHFCTGKWCNDIFFAGKGSILVRPQTTNQLVVVDGVWQNGVCIPDPDKQRVSNAAVMKRVLELLHADSSAEAEQQAVNKNHTVGDSYDQIETPEDSSAKRVRV